jgi:GGDEF domain-containing protein
MASQSASVLIIGDERECNEVATAIPRTITGLKRAGEDLQLDIITEELVLHRSWEVDFGSGTWDLAVFYLSSRDANLFIANNALLQDRTRGLMIISERQRSLPPNWKLRNRIDSLLTRPFTDNMLCARLELLLCNLFLRQRQDIQELELVDFVRHLLETPELNKTLEPTYQEDPHDAVTYPVAKEFFGLNTDPKDILEHLVSLEILNRQIRNRIRCCQTCGSHRLNYREQCPSCHAIDYLSETIIHHFPCGHMDSLANYQQEGQLVCPKCSRVLRHIGLDYDKPAMKFRCNACDYIFADPRVEVECMHCQTCAEPAETDERVIHGYRLTAYAEEVAKSGSVNAIDLGALLRSQDGLHSRQLFLYELRREIVRWQRYKTACSLVLVRLNELEHLQQDLGEELPRYVQLLFAGISSQLRTLDMTCVWDNNLLAVLLPGTPLEGAWVVARRMEERCADVNLPMDLKQARVSCSAETISEENSEADQLIASALRVHDYIADIAAEDFMPE